MIQLKNNLVEVLLAVALLVNGLVSSSLLIYTLGG